MILAALLALQVVFLALRTRSQPLQTSVSVAADILMLIAPTVGSGPPGLLDPDVEQA